MNRIYLVTLCICMAAFSTHASTDFETVALTNTSAPGSGAAVFTAFNNVRFNEQGQASFFAVIGGSGVGPGSDGGVWFYDDHDLSMIVREGDIAPGAGSAIFATFNSLRLNDSGQTQLFGVIGGPGVNGGTDGGLWLNSNGALDLLVREGASAPGTGGAIYSTFNNTQLGGTDQGVFFGVIGGSGVSGGTDGGLWFFDNGSLDLVIREGDAAVGTPGAIFSTFNNIRANESGELAFFGVIGGPGVNGATDGGIWSVSGSGSVDLLIREGDSAPGAGSAVFNTFNNIDINDSGDIVFFGVLSGSGVNGSTDGGIWTGRNGAVDLVVREGVSAPGTTGAIFSTFTDIELNNDGDTAFLGVLSGSGVNGSTDGGIWFEQNGVLDLVYREGDLAPEAGGASFAAFDNLRVNDSDALVFFAALTGSGVNGNNDAGIWAIDPDGEAHLIVREGDLFDVNDDPLIEDLRTIAFVSAFNNIVDEEIFGSSLNNSNELLLRLTFTDGTQGLFVTTVPEPSTLILVYVAGAYLVTRRRPKRKNF